jgi:hypothetical protein
MKEDLLLPDQPPHPSGSPHIEESIGHNASHQHWSKPSCLFSPQEGEQKQYPQMV